MSSITQFSASTVEAIKSYVYVLTDETDRVFYVGKGTGNRVFAHVAEVQEALARGAALPDEEADDGEVVATMGQKRDRIAAMLRQGKVPGMYIVRDGLTPEQALLVESVLIGVFAWQLEGGLTNAVSGHGESTFGLKSVAELEATKGLPFDVRSLPDLGNASLVIAINVNKRYAEVESREKSLLDIAKGYWKLNASRARQCPYAIIHARGIVRGVFRIADWKPSTEMPGRYEFVPVTPEPLPGADFSNRNVDKLFADAKIGSQNPIRYISVGPMTA